MNNYEKIKSMNIDEMEELLNKLIGSIKTTNKKHFKKYEQLYEENLLLKKKIEQLTEQVCFPKFFTSINKDNFQIEIKSKIELPKKDLEINEMVIASSEITKEHISFLIEQQIKNISKEYCIRGYEYWRKGV